jgi:hypothetical protein
MDKKQADRRPGEKPAEQGQGKYDPSKPESGRRMPEVREGSKKFGQSEDHPIDKQAPKPGTRSGGKDILDGDRSDRESGRPLQLEDDDESQTFPPGQPGRADAERGLGRRPQEGDEDRKPYEAEKTKR